MSDKTLDQLEPALYVVATPIGNLGDLSARARAVLIAANAVYAEDTRHSQQMFRQLGIPVRARSLHQHNERSRADEILACVRNGEAVALVSDAGTPLISDPGGRVVELFHDEGLPVRAVPGPSAVTAALSISGLSAEAFRFHGFLPAKAGPRDRFLAQLVKATETLVFFEAPHRLVAGLSAMRDQFGHERRATVVRELTKRFEIARRGDLASLCSWVEADPDQQRGEIVVVVEGCAEEDVGEAVVTRERLVATLAAELPPRQAATVAARLLGGEKNAWYQEILTHKPRH